MRHEHQPWLCAVEHIVTLKLHCRRPDGSVGMALVLPALTDCRWWFESLLVHSGVSSATRRKATVADHKKNLEAALSVGLRLPRDSGCYFARSAAPNTGTLARESCVIPPIFDVETMNEFDARCHHLFRVTNALENDRCIACGYDRPVLEPLVIFFSSSVADVALMARSLHESKQQKLCTRTQSP